MSMKTIRDLSLQTLDEIFRLATKTAKAEAGKQNLPIYGVDAQGNLLTPDTPDPTFQSESDLAGRRNLAG
jgi:hypothetical protein